MEHLGILMQLADLVAVPFLPFRYFQLHPHRHSHLVDVAVQFVPRLVVTKVVEFAMPLVERLFVVALQLVVFVFLRPVVVVVVIVDCSVES